MSNSRTAHLIGPLSSSSRLVVPFGLLADSISLAELADAATGQPLRQLNSYLKLANVEAAELYLDGLALLRAANQIRRALSQDFSQVTGRATDWLVTLQSAIASEVCDCSVTGQSAEAS